MNPRNSETTGTAYLEPRAERSIGGVHGEIGYGVQPKPAQQAATVIDVEAQLKSHGIVLKRNEVSLQAGATANIPAALSMLRQSLQPATGEAIFDWLSKLSSMTVSQTTTDDARKDSMKLYRAYLSKYPADIVRDVIRNWPLRQPCTKYPTGGKFFPALAELAWECSDLAEKRKAMIDQVALLSDDMILPERYYLGDRESQLRRCKKTLCDLQANPHERPLDHPYRPSQMRDVEWRERRDAFLNGLRRHIERLEAAA